MPVTNPFQAINEDYQYVDSDFEPDTLTDSVTDGSGTYTFHTQQIATGQVKHTLLAQHVAFADGAPTTPGGGGGSGLYTF